MCVGGEAKRRARGVRKQIEAGGSEAFGYVLEENSRNLNETLPGVQIVMPGKKTLDQYAMDISSIILFGLDARPGRALKFFN